MVLQTSLEVKPGIYAQEKAGVGILVLIEVVAIPTLDLI